MLVAVVGMAGSGKTTLCKHLEAAGFAVLGLSALLAEEVKRRGLEATAANETRLRLELFDRLGEDALAQIALPWLREHESKSGPVILEGPYSYSEYKRLRAEFGEGLVVVAVMVSKHKRHQRLVDRKERPITYQRAQERDLMEVEETGRPQLIAMADYVLLNESDDIEAYLEQAVTLIRRLDETGSHPSPSETNPIEAG